MRTSRALCLLAATTFVIAGCEKKPAATPPKPATSPAGQTPVKPPATPAAPATTPPPAPTAPIVPPPTPSGGAAAPATMGTDTVKVGSLSFPVPAGWKQVTPGMSMRLAEVQAPDPSGDPARVCTVVFATAGGDVQANIDRWALQVKDAAGGASKPKVETRTVNGLTVHVAEMSGSYANMGEQTPHSNWTLRGAIIETTDGGGLLFVKMTGPAEQMAAAGPGFSAMIDGMKKQ
jgi:hypothetical protein